MMDDSAAAADADERSDQQRLADLMERLQEQSDEARLLEESIGRIDEVLARSNARMRTRGGGDGGVGPAAVDEDLGVTNDIVEDDGQTRPQRQPSAQRRRREERRRGVRNAVRIYLAASVSLAILAVVASPADVLFSSIKGSMAVKREAHAAQISQAVENLARTTHDDDERRIVADLLSGYPGLGGLNNLDNGGDGGWEKVASALRAAGRPGPGGGPGDSMPGSSWLGYLGRGLTRRYLLWTDWLQWGGDRTPSDAGSANVTRAKAEQDRVQSVGRWQLPWNRRGDSADATHANSTRAGGAARRTEAADVGRARISALLWDHFHPPADVANATACKSADSGYLGPSGGKGTGGDGRPVPDGPDGRDLLRSTAAKVLSSAPRTLAVANLVVALAFVAQHRLADLFLGPVAVPPDSFVGVDGRYPRAVREALRRRGSGREKLASFLFFKVLLVSAILEPDSADFLCLLLWFASLALSEFFLVSSFCHRPTDQFVSS